MSNNLENPMNEATTKKELSAKQQLNAGRKMVTAALDALGARLDHNAVPQIENHQVAQRVIKALVAARKAKKDEQIRLKEYDGYINTDPYEAVATAFWLWSQDIDLSVAEVHPSCHAGGVLLGFAIAYASASNMERSIDLLERPDAFMWIDDEAERLVNVGSEEE